VGVQGMSIDLQGLAACLSLLPRGTVLETNAFGDAEDATEEEEEEEEDSRPIESVSGASSAASAANERRPAALPVVGADRGTSDAISALDRLALGRDPVSVQQPAAPQPQQPVAVDGLEDELNFLLSGPQQGQTAGPGPPNRSLEDWLDAL
jgi:hypothetical protein